jgi:hypothetical protein
MWFDEDINLTIETDPVINVSGTVEFSNIDTIVIHEFEQPIIIQTSEYFAPVQSVNGKIGFVNLTAEDLGISGVDLSSYATKSGLSATGQNLDNKINLLSGYVEEENILVFTAELPSGEETAFLTYPFSLGSSPSSITCSFQNTIDNVIYTYTLGQITQSGFHANFSDILTNSGYLLKVKVKK